MPTSKGAFSGRLSSPDNKKNGMQVVEGAFSAKASSSYDKNNKQNEIILCTLGWFSTTQPRSSERRRKRCAHTCVSAGCSKICTTYKNWMEKRDYDSA